jgi:hypothetical protein
MGSILDGLLPKNIRATTVEGGLNLSADPKDIDETRGYQKTDTR